jgi:hypothetical protein
VDGHTDVAADCGENDDVCKSDSSLTLLADPINSRSLS